MDRKFVHDIQYWFFFFLIKKFLFACYLKGDKFKLEYYWVFGLKFGLAAEFPIYIKFALDTIVDWQFWFSLNNIIIELSFWNCWFDNQYVFCFSTFNQTP